MLTGSMASHAWGISRTTHKLFWNQITPSDRQTGDVAGIVAVQGDRLDYAYLRQWAVELGLSDDLEKALAGGFRPKST